MATIQQLTEAHKGEWLAIAVLRDSPSGPQDGELLYHSTDRDDVWKRIKGDRRRVYVTYGGPPLEEGYAAAF